MGATGKRASKKLQLRVALFAEDNFFAHCKLSWPLSRAWQGGSSLARRKIQCPAANSAPNPLKWDNTESSGTVSRPIIRAAQFCNRLAFCRTIGGPKELAPSGGKSSNFSEKLEDFPLAKLEKPQIIGCKTERD